MTNAYAVITRDAADARRHFAIFAHDATARRVAAFLRRLGVRAYVDRFPAGELRAMVNDGLGDDIAIAWYVAPQGVER